MLRVVFSEEDWSLFCRAGPTFFPAVSGSVNGGALLSGMLSRGCRGQVFQQREQFSLGEGSLQVQMLPFLVQLLPGELFKR